MDALKKIRAPTAKPASAPAAVTKRSTTFARVISRRHCETRTVAADQSRGRLRQRHGRALRAEALKRIGADVIPLDTKSRFTFPRYNPITEDLNMLHAIADAVKSTRPTLLASMATATVAASVDDQGREIFGRKGRRAGARDLSSRIPMRNSSSM